MKDKEFVLGLILEEEKRLTAQAQNAQTSQDSTDDSKIDEVIILQKQDFVMDKTFRLNGQDSEGNVYETPFMFQGFLDTFVFKASSDQFRATVQVDKFDVLDRQNFADLKDISIELSHIGAFESNGFQVLSVSSYPFDERLHIEIEPLEDMAVTLARAEIVKGASADGSNLLDSEEADLLSGI